MPVDDTFTLKVSLPAPPSVEPLGKLALAVAAITSGVAGIYYGLKGSKKK